MSQVLQVEGPGSEFLPVDPLKGHDAVQVATQLWAREKHDSVFKARNTKMCKASSNGHDLDNLFGLAVLNPPLCVANVQVFRVLRVEVSHNVCPPLRESPMFTSSKTTGEYSWEGLGQGLLFTVDGSVFPTGLTNQNPVFHFVYREGSP